MESIFLGLTALNSLAILGLIIVILLDKCPCQQQGPR